MIRGVRHGVLLKGEQSSSSARREERLLQSGFKVLQRLMVSNKLLIA